MAGKYFEFVNSVKILCGDNAIENIAYELDFFGCKNPLLLSDEGLKKIGTVEKVTKILKNVGIKNVYTNIPADSSTATINEIIKYYKDSKCDGIIALGGGSVIDTAKGVRMSLSQGKNDIMKLMGNENIKKGNHIPFIVVPTTCGTGSECTAVAVIKNHDNNVKMEFISSELLPDVAVIDVRMTATLPPKLTASTSMDAMVHAIEAYTSLQKNPISDVYAVSAIKLIADNLLKVLKNPNDMDGRYNLALASTLAGIAFSNAMVGVVHAIGHACGGVCGVPHGNAMAVLLTECMKYNQDKVGDLYGELLLHLCGSNVFATTNRENKCEKTIAYLENMLKEINKITGMPLKLGDYGVKEEDLNKIVATAQNDGAIVVNKKHVKKEDIMSILKKCL